MSSVAPAPPFPVELLFSIRLPTWRALFDARGYPPALDASTVAGADLALVASALAAPDLPLSLRRALFTLLAFAAEAGRVDIYSAAHALGHPIPWSDASSPCDLAALLVAAAATDAAARETLDAAQVLRDRAFRPIATQIYAGVAGPDPDLGSPTQYEEPWNRELSAWCARRGFGAVVRVAGRTWKSVVTFEVAHEDRLVTYVTRDVASPDLAPHVARPVRSHALVYDARSRGLGITTDCMEAMTPLAMLAGVVLFGDARHFLSAAAVDLWKLQELGREALNIRALADKVATSAVGGTWHSGKNHAMTPRGRDFFEALARYKIRIEGGRLDLMTLRGKVVAPEDGPGQCDVALRPPHLFTVSEPELAPLMRDVLDRASITRPVARIRDFYSLQPWIDPGGPWIDFEGEAGFAELVRRGILQADPTNRSVTPPDHPYAGRTATAYPLPSGKLLAWSPDPTIAPFVTREEDLVVYALSFERLAAMIAEQVGLEGPATELDDDGVLFCGRRALGPTYVLLFLPTRPIRPATVERLREAAGHGHAVLVVPEGRFEKHGLRQLAMPKLAGPWRPILGAMVRALKLEPIVDTTLYAPEDARVVLHRATQRVWLDGVLCAKVTEMSFKLLDFLVAQNGAPVHTRDIALHLRGNHWHDDTTRKAIEGLIHGLEASFKARKVKPPKDLHALLGKPKHGHYVLQMPAFAD